PNQFVCPIGESVRISGSTIDTCCSPSTRMYLGVGDMVTLAFEHNVSTTKTTGNDVGGSHFSIRFCGYSNSDDRVQLNSSISSAGSVTGHQPQPQNGTSTFTNTHTYSYYGQRVGSKRRSVDGFCWQGTAAGDIGSTGSQVSQIVFNAVAIDAALAG